MPRLCFVLPLLAVMPLIYSGCSEPSSPPPLANAELLGREARTLEALVALPAAELDISTAATGSNDPR